MRDDAFYETAAKEFCRLTNTDPDALVGHSPEPNADGSVNAVYLQSPYYMIVMKSLKQADAVRKAFQFADATHRDRYTDPCPACQPGTVCRTPVCGRLKQARRY